MASPFRSAAVLGAGTMGAQIAAHLANAGLTVTLLDVSADAAKQGLARLKTLKPDPYFVPDVLSQITPGSLETDAARLADAEWVVEAVVESLDVKRALLEKLAPHLTRAAAISSNTSGIPIGDIAQALPPALRGRWLGTHFFNPPRYLHLLELIPTPHTSADVVQRLQSFADVHLGKGVVVARDTPGFIGNRIGMYGAIRSIALVAAGTFTIEEIDAVTGPLIGRPKSATFRTMDIAGVDIVARVAADLAARLNEAEGGPEYAAPPLLAQMVERGLLGAKTGKGFYQRVKDKTAGEDSTILVLDPATLDYKPLVSPKLGGVEAAMAIPDLGARIKTLFLSRDRVGDLLRQTLGPTLTYAARVAKDIANDPADVDRAMRWGFGWALGPFETIAAIGPEHLGLTSSAAVHTAPKRRVVKTNAGASLVAVADDVLNVEFHSKLNTIGGDAIAMLQAGVDEAARNFGALTIANDGEHFSAGANLMLVLLEAQEGNWDEIDAMVRGFQHAMMTVRYAPIPVVAAPASLALGGGCEICLHASRVRASAETYMGLVEVGVGLLPAGGGTKEMLRRATAIQTAFETIGFAKVSTSAAHARKLGYLRDADAITMNRDRLLDDAIADARALARAGYHPPAPNTLIPVGGPDAFATLSLGIHLARTAGAISAHDAVIGRHIARVLSGGDVPHRTSLTEQQVLDLEREAFLKLCGEPKTLERIAYTLKTGKTLRN